MRDLPIGWSKPKLSDVYWFQEGPGVRNWQFKQSGVKLLNVANITTEGVLDLSKTDRHLDLAEVTQKYQHFLVDAGDLVIASSGISFDDDGFLRTRGVFIEEKHLPLCMNTSTIRFKAKEGVSDLNFFKYWLQSYEFRNQVSKFVTGTAQLNFGPSHLKKMHITLPPLGEQQRIAAVLDKADALRAKRRHALARLDALLQSTFLHLFGDPVTNPMGWEVKPISKITDVKTGSTPSRDQEGNYGGEVHWVKTTEVDWGIITNTEETVTKQGIESARLKIYPKGSVIIAMYGQGKTRGKSAVLGIDATVNQACAVLLPSDKLKTEYISILLRHSYKSLRELGRGGNQPNLNLSLVKSFEIPLPPIELQARFAETVKTIQRMQADHARHLYKLDNLFHALQQRAFKGEL